MKKASFLIIIVLTVLYIYLKTTDKDIYYLALGDQITTSEFSFPNNVTKYLMDNKIHEITIKEFAKEGYRTVDLYNDINSNKKLIINDKQITIKNAIIKADIITISIGINDYIAYIDEPYILRNNFKNLRSDMEQLLKTIRNISKEKIMLIGIYNPSNIKNRVIEDINETYKEIAKKNNIIYLDIYDKIENNNYKDNKYLNEEAYNYIFENLIKYMASDIIN